MTIKSLLISYEELSKLIGKKIIGVVPRKDGNLEILHMQKDKKKSFAKSSKGEEQ